MQGPAPLAVVIVTHDSARDIEGGLPAVVEQLRDGDELVIVDSASTDGTPAIAKRLAPDAQVIEPGSNVGFAAGANIGATATQARLLLLLNPDARPLAGCLDRLREPARDLPRWGAWQALVTLPGGDRVNTSGGVTHFLGFGWAGQQGEPIATAPDRPVEVSFASGAALAVRRELWDELGGFEEGYFMYGEDLDLSLRVWLAGHDVGVVPAARVEHDYEFAKGPGKWYLLERNRWQTVLGTYPGPLLAALAPALLLFELALLPVAAAGGWLPQKLRAQAWVVRSLPALMRRRRRVQRHRQVSALAFARRLDARLDSPFLGAAARIGPLVVLQRVYWRAVLALLARGGG